METVRHKTDDNGCSSDVHDLSEVRGEIRLAFTTAALDSCLARADVVLPNGSLGLRAHYVTRANCGIFGLRADLSLDHSHITSIFTGVFMIYLSAFSSLTLLIRTYICFKI